MTTAEDSALYTHHAYTTRLSLCGVFMSMCSNFALHVQSLRIELIWTELNRATLDTHVRNPVNRCISRSAISFSIHFRLKWIIIWWMIKRINVISAAMNNANGGHGLFPIPSATLITRPHPFHSLILCLSSIQQTYQALNWCQFYRYYRKQKSDNKKTQHIWEMLTAQHLEHISVSPRKMAHHHGLNCRTYINSYREKHFFLLKIKRCQFLNLKIVCDHFCPPQSFNKESVSHSYIHLPASYCHVNIRLVLVCLFSH